MFKSDTRIAYCCYTVELKREGIILPRDKPFYLFPYGSAKCQPVVGTTVSLEYIRYDLENDDGLISGLYSFKGFYPFAKITPKKSYLVLLLL